MGALALSNISYSRDVLVSHDHFEKMEENERKINRFQEELTSYLEKVDIATLPPADKLELQHSIFGHQQHRAHFGLLHAHSQRLEANAGA